MGYTAPKIAQQCGCSASLIYRRLHAEGFKQADRYTNISDQELDAVVNGLHKNHPNSGVVVIGVTITYKKTS